MTNGLGQSKNIEKQNSNFQDTIALRKPQTSKVQWTFTTKSDIDAPASSYCTKKPSFDPVFFCIQF